MIGLGTQDSLGQAQDFVRDNGTSFTMLWDQSFETWFHFGISGQPSAVLVDREGGIVQRWNGGPPFNTVLDLVDDL